MRIERAILVGISRTGLAGSRLRANNQSPAIKGGAGPPDCIRSSRRSLVLNCRGIAEATKLVEPNRQILPVLDCRLWE